jgi:soluble lytic murein transglycosylase-like protein
VVLRAGNRAGNKSPAAAELRGLPPETRNYVQRVIENYEVYKARLGQPVSIQQDLIGGRNAS